MISGALREIYERRGRVVHGNDLRDDLEIHVEASFTLATLIAAVLARNIVALPNHEQLGRFADQRRWGDDSVVVARIEARRALRAARRVS